LTVSTLELVCAAIVLVWIVLRARRDPSPRHLLLRLGLLAAAGWVGEDTMIRAYHFYAYSEDTWAIFIDRVPLAIAMIWPVVIHSAWDLARVLARASPRAVPFIAGAIVLADAALIEPIAVRAGLWRWTEPGLFAVPPIGVVGWAVFAVLAIAVLTGVSEKRRLRADALAVIVLAPAGTHAVLLALWWSLFRSVNGEVAPEPAIAVLVILSVAATLFVLRSRAAARVRLGDLVVRIPGAAFFFVLLAAHAEDGALVAWTLAFAAPYLALTFRAAVRARRQRSVVAPATVRAEDLVDGAAPGAGPPGGGLRG
jgi:hypothetical protein